MGLFNRNKNRNKDPADKSILQMVNTYTGGFYTWNGKLYESDIVRACIRPKVQAIGKLVGKHIRSDAKGLMVNPDARVRFLLSEPNPYMTGQQMQEKVATQLCLNNNAFILIVRDENGIPVQLYPVPCIQAETIYDTQGNLYLKFYYKNGRCGTFCYDDIIHLRQDYNEDDVFGTSPAKALSQLMNAIGTIDDGMVKAIRNSSMVQWLLLFKHSMRPEDVKENVKNFVANYLDISTESLGAAGVDSKAEVKRVEPKDYVPNAAQTDRIVERIYSFFNTNKKIVQSTYNEDEWNAYYEAEIEPVVVQLGDTYTIGLFSRKERGYRNEIVFEANNLNCASLTTKLAFQAMVDRGAMTPNEWRATMNLAPVADGDKPIRRLDTQVVNMANKLIDKMNDKNYTLVTELVKQLTAEGGDKDGKDRDKRSDDPE